MKIAVCEDDNIVAAYLEGYLSSLSVQNIEYEIFTSGNDLIHYMEQEKTSFNIFFMDIEMSGRNGIETSAYIRKHDKNALIIFITDHQDYVYQVFEVLPFRFLIKPVQREQLNTVLKDAILQINTAKKLFFFKIGKQQFQVAYDEILYFEGNLRKVRLVSTVGEWDFYGKISKVFSDLDVNLFLQSHSSFLVNMEYIRCITETEITLTNGMTIPISKKFRDSVKQRHMEYVEWRCGNG